MADWNGDLEGWLAPFLARLGHKARRRMCPLYVAGLIGPGDRKSVEPMAARFACQAKRSGWSASAAPRASANTIYPTCLP
jgi:SRSO17 transposase